MGQEALAYNRLHPSLLHQYLGQYVAILDGQIVDSDRDQSFLQQRVMRAHGEQPIFIIQVAEQPLPVFNAPRPRLNQRTR